MQYMIKKFQKNESKNNVDILRKYYTTYRSVSKKISKKLLTF